MKIFRFKSKQNRTINEEYAQISEVRKASYKTEAPTHTENVNILAQS